MVRAGGHIYDMVNDRLRVMREVSLPVDGPLKAVSLVELGFTDPVRLFVKNEPHSIEKLKNERYRLVSSVSVCDEIVERLLFSEQNDIEIDSWRTCPSKPGMGLSSDEQNAELFGIIEPHLGRKLYDSDAAGWDWGFQSWFYDMDRRRRELCASGPGYELWKKFMFVRFEALKWTMFITSDGVVYIQTKPGVMLSGSYVTSSTNSGARVSLATLLGAEWAIAMGDDAGEENSKDPEKLIEEYDFYGVRIKEIKRCEHEFEFCSHVFRDGKAYPLNFWKGAYRLLSKPPSEMELLQFANEYRNVPDELERLVAFMQSLPSWCGTLNAI
nr:RNA-dependent RNA polymerase [Sobelivirales sp.]